MERFRKDLFIEMGVDMFIFSNNQIMLLPHYTLIPKATEGLPKTGVGFK